MTTAGRSGSARSARSGLRKTRERAPAPHEIRANIGVYVERLTTDVASIWYRALYPAASLAENGWRVDVFDAAPGASRLKRYDALVIVKVLNPRALALALEARRLGVPVFLDLCDDIFVPEYGAGKGREAAYFKATAQLASAVLTTGPVMAELLRNELGEGVPIAIIEDPAETVEQNLIVYRYFRRWRFRATLRQTLAVAAQPISAFRGHTGPARRTAKLISRSRVVLLHKARRTRNMALHIARLQRKHLLRSLAVGLHKARRGRNLAMHLAARLRRRLLRAGAVALHKVRRGRNIAIHVAARIRRRLLRAGAVALHKVRRGRNIAIHVAARIRRRLLRAGAVALHKVRRGRNLGLHLSRVGCRRLARNGALTLRQIRHSQDAAKQSVQRLRTGLLRAGSLAVRKLRLGHSSGLRRRRIGARAVQATARFAPGGDRDANGASDGGRPCRTRSAQWRVACAR